MNRWSGASALRDFDVSRETTEKLTLLVNELARWQSIKNLVGPATLEEVWSRHIADSLQLLDLAPDAQTWLDLGSGAGFPGLVVAIAGAHQGLKEVHLVESNDRKCAFLRHIARLTAAPVTIHAKRLEDVIPGFVGRTDIVSARALAALDQLLAWTEPLLTAGTTGLFPKGRDGATELTQARKTWTFALDSYPSRTDSSARILKISSLGKAAS